MDFRFLQRRLRNIGLSRDHARCVAHYFNFQVEHQGYQGAVVFFKRLGAAIIHGIDPNTQKATWVATAFRYPKKLTFLREYPVGVQFKVAKIARAIRYQEVQRAQSEKVLKGVTAPYSGTVDGTSLLSALIRVGLEGLTISKFPEKVTYPEIGRQFNKVQSVSGRVPVTMEPPIKESLDLIGNTVFELLPGISQSFYPLYVERLYNLPEDHPRDLPEVVGEIHAAQEGGGKLRMFASPYTIFQVALTPLHEFLAKFRRQLKTDCTHNQDAGALWAQARLQNGDDVASVDLSTATCRFPLEPQLDLLVMLGVPQIWIDCLTAICRGRWRVGKQLVDSGFFPDFLKWEVGQPLGIRPSMSLFSTAHNLLLRGLCAMKGLNPEDAFRILGDDVVMVKELYELYLAVVTSAGIPISWDKTFVSDTYAEFAGYSIHPDALVRPGQWRRATTQNFIELAKWAEVPLEGEVGPELLEIQKLVLFQQGLYVPPPDQYRKFLRASTQLLMRGIEQPDWIRNPIPWLSGFKKVCEDQLGDHVTFFPYVKPMLDSVWLPLRDLPHYQDAKWQLEESEWYSINTALDFGVDLVYRALNSGHLNWESGAQRLKLLLEAVSSWLWLPPSVSTDSDKVTHSKLQDLLQSLQPKQDLLDWTVSLSQPEIAL